MGELLKNLQEGDLEKNIEEIVKNIGLKLPEESGSSSGGEGEGDKAAEEADLSTILSAFAALDGGSAGEGQESGSSSSENVASKISDRLKEIAENAKNKGVWYPTSHTILIFSPIFLHMKIYDRLKGVLKTKRYEISITHTIFLPASYFVLSLQFLR